MSMHVVPTSGLTDGRSKIIWVCSSGSGLSFKAGEFKKGQSRSDMDFNADMVSLSSISQGIMDRLNCSEAINDPVLYEAQPLHSPCLIFPVDIFIWLCYLLTSTLAFSGFLCLHCPLKSLVSASMPRSRGIPRRGGRSGIRANPSHSAPQQVSPIASVPPASPPSDQEGIISNNSYHSSRFVFHSQLNRPVVTVNFTVFVSEEERNPVSPTPFASSNSQDDSILLGNMAGRVFHVERWNEEATA